MSRAHRGYPKEDSGKGLKIGLVLAGLVALALAGVLVNLALFSNDHSERLGGPTSLLTHANEEQAPTIAGYTITLDTSAYPGAALAENKVFSEFGQQVSSLPFATLDSMRFTGWFTGPIDDAGATRVDNNSLYLLALDTDQTLYAHFDPRPTSIDYDDPGLPILMYHYFYDPALGEDGEDVNWMDIHLFESHLAWLQSQNYYYPTWEEVVAYIRGEIVLPQPSIVLTSDDGFESFFRLALPLVAQYDARMTSFIILAQQQPDMFTGLDPSRVIFQSHSYDMHQGGYDGDARILTASYDEIYEDALIGGQILGNMLAYCYPFGKTNANARQALFDAGVGVALVIENERAYPLCDPMAVPRLRMSDGASAEYLASVAY